MDNCAPCDPGMYCDAPGILNPRGPCDPGFVCYGGAKESGPTDGVTGEICLAGGYCTGGEYRIRKIPPSLHFEILHLARKKGDRNYR